MLHPAVSRYEWKISPFFPSVLYLIKMVLFFYKGDTSIFAYEITAEPPHLFELSQIKVAEAHQVSCFIFQIFDFVS